jgi:hypothetical protein
MSAMRLGSVTVVLEESMLSDAKFVPVRNAVRNWGMVGHPRAAAHADELAPIHAAMAEGKDIAALVSQSLRDAVGKVREEENSRGADELERMRAGLSDADGDALEQIVARHKLGLPSFTTEWRDEDLIAWWASLQGPADTLEAFGGDFKGWWKRVENKLT